jgi:eukaryotic-like serine/threonine-protein kinase
MSSAATPTRIGPYEIVSRLGVGGMAETYVAVRRGPGTFAQRVCLKRLRPELEGDPEFVRQFLAEAAIAARMRHAAIAQVLDFGQDGADYYLALELIEGCDLRQLLQAAGGALSPALVLHIAIELATALDVAHRIGGGAAQDAVVHRDVSPSNTLVSSAGEVKLTDFGIARAVRGPKYTRTGIVKGKVPYMAPEYARSARLDPRSDLFSLGVLLYECACGERPHDGATELETLERAGRGQRASLAERAPAVPPPLVEIIECLLEPDPELRYQTASDLLEALLSLPAPSRARLELGALVSAVMRARAASPEASQHEGAAAATEIMEQTGAHAGPAGRVRVRVGRSAWAALALASLIALTVAAFALLRAPARSSGTQPTAAIVVEPAGATPLASTPALPHMVVRPEPDGRSLDSPLADVAPGAIALPPTTTRVAPVQTGNAWIEVVVLPFGDVSIDGKPVGRAPVTVRSEPGEHTVEAQSRGNLLKRRITVAPGQRKQVVLK